MFFTVMMHIFSGLNYDYLKPYVLKKDPKIFSWHQILSMLILFFGFYQIVKNYYKRETTPLDIYLDAILFTTLPILFFFAIETRFGLLATVVLSIKAVQLFTTQKPSNGEALALYFGATLFTILAALLSYYTLLLSGVLNS